MTILPLHKKAAGMIDHVLLWLVRRRLARYRRRGDSADKLGDQLIQVLSAEIARRAETDRAGRRPRKVSSIR